MTQSPPDTDRHHGEMDHRDQAATVERLCDLLWDEPMFHLSLNSKELFHSNLLAWFIETYPAEASAAIAPWTSRADEVSEALVLREQSHLDLAIALPGLRPLVIENKVFSPPDDEQLDRYAQGTLAGFNDPVLLLLSLMEPDWTDGTHKSPSGHTWRHVSYRDLSERLVEGESHVRQRQDDTAGFAADLLSHYRRLIDALHELVQVTGAVNPNDPVDIPSDYIVPLTRVRLQGAIGKLRARQAIREFRADLPVELANKVRWESSFTNGTPLMSAYYPLDNGDHIGWQYQQGQWRLMVVTRDFHGKAAQADRHAYVARNYLDWFDFEPFGELTGRPVSKATRTEAAGGFNGFNPDFVHRYRKAPALTLGDLIALSTYYLERAHQRSAQ